MTIGEHIDDYMSVSLNELRWLHETAKNMKSIVEIGSCKGRSTYALCSSGCPQVIAVDDFGCGTKAEFLENTKEFKNLTLLEMLSKDAVDKVSDTDMVFIDGMHDYEHVMEDLILWGNKAKILLCGHDYRPNTPWTDVQRAVNNFLGYTPLLFETIWYVEVRNNYGIN